MSVLKSREREREREIKREGERERDWEREIERGRERELHAHACRKCGHVLSVPHSVSQSACMIIFCS
jgi:hypothetical protein